MDAVPDEYAIARSDPEVDFAHYLACRSKGSTHSMAMILASGRAPGTDRTDERWRGMQDEDAHVRGIKARGKYQPGLARFPGDPQAVVSSRAEARKVAAKNGWTIQDGPVNHDRPVQRRQPAGVS